MYSAALYRTATVTVTNMAGSQPATAEDLFQQEVHCFVRASEG